MPWSVRSAVSIRRAADTISLSAIGSSMRPSEDSALSLRAIMPSTASVSPARQNSRKTIQRPGSSGRKNAATNSGTSAMREMVRLLGSDDMAAVYRRDGAEVRQSWLFLPSNQGEKSQKSYGPVRNSPLPRFPDRRDLPATLPEPSQNG